MSLLFSHFLECDKFITFEFLVLIYLFVFCTYVLSILFSLFTDCLNIFVHLEVLIIFCKFHFLLLYSKTETHHFNI